MIVALSATAIFVGAITVVMSLVAFILAKTVEWKLFNTDNQRSPWYVRLVDAITNRRNANG